MLIILISFAVGCLTGFLFKKIKWISKASNTISLWVISALLFLLGWSVGNRDDLFNNLPTISGQAFLLSIFGVAGSIVAARIFSKFIHSSKHSPHEPEHINQS